MDRKKLARRAYNTAVDRVPPAAEPVSTELRAIDCTTPKQWEQWAAERREYEDPCGYERTRY